MSATGRTVRYRLERSALRQNSSDDVVNEGTGTASPAATNSFAQAVCTSPRFFPSIHSQRARSRSETLRRCATGWFALATIA